MEGLHALDSACLAADGAELVRWDPYEALLAAPDTILISAAVDGQIAAAGWLRANGSLARLGGKVHPEHRRKGLGSFALHWSERRARTIPGVTAATIRNEAFHETAGALYTRHGYGIDFIEYWMLRELDQPLPGMPPGFRLAAWSDETARQFYDTYIASFADRGGPPRESAEDWIRHQTDEADFRPDLCLLALAGEEPAGFAVAGLLQLPYSGEKIGWISQIGVRPEWRGRGIADGLIGTIAERVRQGATARLGLDVNLNNPRAFHVYDRLGFKIAGQRAKFSKIFKPD